MQKLLLPTLIFLFFVSTISAQKKCISHEILNKNLNQNLSFKDERYKISQFTTEYLINNNSKRVNSQSYTIPVVVHVVHNGEAIGIGANISDEQILSQITVLNKDFSLLNSDKLDSSHPFYNLIADTEIQFCLAKQDANGNKTSGIKRYNLRKEVWTANQVDSEIKPLTAWDRNKYLNIWIVTLGGEDEGTLGYATFPGTNDASDGVVIVGIYFGTTGSVVEPYNLGRTATHEVGHYLNLYHIWGDSDCGDDEVSDTEPQFASSSGCPEFPSNPLNSCGSSVNGEMYMNYMDYSDDNCMNMFTLGQKTRMRAALEGPRSSLLNSIGCEDPNSVNDINASYFELFPNPSNNLVNLSFKNHEDIISVHLITAQGEELKSWSFINNNPEQFIISTNSYSSGTYWVNVKTKNGSFNQKLLIIK